MGAIFFPLAPLAKGHINAAGSAFGTKIAITETYSVGDTVKEMYRALVKFKKFTFNKLFSIKKKNKREIVTAFSGLLEMSRRDKVVTKQEELFGDIEVEKSLKK